VFDLGFEYGTVISIIFSFSLYAVILVATIGYEKVLPTWSSVSGEGIDIIIDFNPARGDITAGNCEIF
jgi:hypothetical protein